MRIQQDADTYVKVTVVAVTRDKDGAAVPKTVDTTKVFDASGDEVAQVIQKALQAEAAKNSGRK